MGIKSCLSVSIALLLCVLAVNAGAQVVINEVLFNPDPASLQSGRDHQWIELYNAGTDPVELSGWSVAGADGAAGASARSLPSGALPPGGYLVVHFAAGQNQLDFSNGSGDFYTGDSAYWNVDADEAGLYSPGGIADFIDWMRSTAVYQPGQAHLDAVAAKIWTQGAVLVHDRIGQEKLQLVRYVVPGDSIGRDASSTDSNQPSDFDAHGGPSSLGPTPGFQNLTFLVADIADAPSAAKLSPRAAPAKKPWTVLLFLNGDNNLESALYLNLLSLQQAGGSNENVNFVAMYDPKTIMAGTYRGLIAGPQTDQISLTLTDGNNPMARNRVTLPKLDLTAHLSNLLPEQDMGDPAVLKEFIRWGKENFPADKYALILSSHGDGWKSFGPDESSPGTRQPNDSLYMGELSAALAGQSFEWIAFQACLMGGIEVAYQLEPFTRYLLASEEIMTTGDFPYEVMAQRLGSSLPSSTEEHIQVIFDSWVLRARGNPLGGTVQEIVGTNAYSYTVSVIDMAEVPALIDKIRTWADLLAPGMSLFQKRDDPSDNVQVLTSNQLARVEKFQDKNFIDLFHFSTLMLHSGVPNCLLTPVPGILGNILLAVIHESHGPGHPNANGLHIYFPQFRMSGPTRSEFITALGASGEPYDYPSSRMSDGSSPLAHYGLLQDKLPLKSRDPEMDKIDNGMLKVADFPPGNIGVDGKPIPGVSAVAWPLPQSPGFKFPNDTGWRKVLDRYYHPVADNHILPVMVGGVSIAASASSGGACVNPTDSISVPVGTTVKFSATGSSDADQKSGISPTYYFWDKDAKIGCSGKCVPEPQTVPPGADAGALAVTNLDADQDLANTMFDQKDASGPTFSRACDAPGTFTVTLMTWDDNHLFPYHDTVPDAAYVHPQTASHTAVVSCTALPPTAALCPMSGSMMISTKVLIDLFASAAYIGAVAGTVNFTRSGPGGMQVSLNSSTNQLVPAMGVFDSAKCSLTATGTSNFPIAGFPNVKAQYDLMMSGTKFEIVTGTYKVGLDNTLNGEAQPVTYTVTGTVTNAK